MKKLIKKTCGILLAATLAIGSLNILHTTNAQEKFVCNDKLQLYSEGAIVPIKNDFDLKKQNKSIFSKIFSYNQGTVEQTIYEGLLNTEEEIDISSYNITPDDLRQIMQDIVNTCPDLFYVAGRYSLYVDANNKVTSVVPGYLFSGNELAEKKSQYKTKMNEILSQIETSWSDLEKIVFAHDYLCQNFEYDTDLKNYDAYTFFTTGKGVCQAYTTVFSGIMKELGIEVSTATSDAMGHIWNVVKLDGKWYHVDVTWDDPTNDKFGLASHNHLLVSDTAFNKERNSSNKHHDWVSKYTCIDTTYDNFYWMTDNISTPYNYLNGKWYYSSYNSTNNTTDICEGDLKNRGTSIYNFDKWFVYGSDSYFTRTYCGMDVYNGTLYFNSCDTIYSYSPQSGTSEFVKPDVDGRLCGLRVNGKQLVFSYTKDYNAFGSLAAYEFPENPNPPTEPAPTVNPDNAQVGDLNFDNNVNLDDATILLKAALNIAPLNENQLKVADIDNDGNINLTDATLCLKLALGIPLS